MLKTQAIADLAMMLSGVTSTDRARMAIQRALNSTGLMQAHTLDQLDLQRLLMAIAAEGGAIEEIARQIAVQGLDDNAGLGIVTRVDDPTDRSAA
jgi:hypothetical protein